MSPHSYGSACHGGHHGSSRYDGGYQVHHREIEKNAGAPRFWRAASQSASHCRLSELRDTIVSQVGGEHCIGSRIGIWALVAGKTML